MKSFIKFISGAALIVLFSLALSSYDSVQPVDDPGNGTIVEVVKDQLYGFWFCGEYVLSEKSTVQRKDGAFHNATIIWQLPEGNCAIPDKATKIVSDPIRTWLYTPSGKVIFKYKNNN